MVLLQILGNQSVHPSVCPHSGLFHVSYVSGLVFLSFKFPATFQGYSKICHLLGKLNCCQQNGMLAPAESLRNGPPQKRDCQFSILFERVTSRSCRAEFLPPHRLPLSQFGGRTSKNDSFLITSGR